MIHFRIWEKKVYFENNLESCLPNLPLQKHSSMEGRCNEHRHVNNFSLICLKRNPHV